MNDPSLSRGTSMGPTPVSVVLARGAVAGAPAVSRDQITLVITEAVGNLTLKRRSQDLSQLSQQTAITSQTQPAAQAAPPTDQLGLSCPRCTSTGWLSMNRYCSCWLGRQRRHGCQSTV